MAKRKVAKKKAKKAPSKPAKAKAKPATKRTRIAGQWQPVAPTAADLANLFGVSEHAVEKWRRKGMPVIRGSSGRAEGYDLTSVIPWWAEHVFRSPHHQAHHGRRTETREAIELERLHSMRLDRQLKQGALVPKAPMVRILNAVADIIRGCCETFERQDQWSGVEVSEQVQDAAQEVMDVIDRAVG